MGKVKIKSRGAHDCGTAALGCDRTAARFHGRKWSN